MSNSNNGSEKNVPARETLYDTLYQYAHPTKSVKERLALLEAELGYTTEKTSPQKCTLPSDQKTPPDGIAPQTTVEQVVTHSPSFEDKDDAATTGTGPKNDSIPFPRNFIRDVLAKYAPDGFSHHLPGEQGIRRPSPSQGANRTAYTILTAKMWS